MRSKSFFFCLLVCVAPFACGDDDDNTVASTATQGQPCEREADCDDGNPCTFDQCNLVGEGDKRCNQEPIDGAENPDAEQTDGDCKINGCAEGVEAVLNDNDDTPEDNNNDCMQWQCMDGTAMEIPREIGSRCDFGMQGGVCDDAGVCSCAVSSGQEAWVDPVDGTDAPGQGGRRGSCAFKTLSYALANSNGDIRLVAADYSANTGETLPFVLTGGQALRCFDNNSNTSATLTGNGTSGGGTATLVLEGTDNDISDCVIDAGGADHGILITGDGAATDHDVRDSSVSNAVNCITQTTTGAGLDLEDSTISNCSGIGVSFEAMGADGQLDNSQFSSNGTDVVCVDASPNVDGAGNVINSCTTCENCNF